MDGLDLSLKIMYRFPRLILPLLPSLFLVNCAWYSSDLNVQFDPHSNPTDVGNTSTSLHWYPKDVDMDGIPLIYAGERYHDGAGRLTFSIVDSKRSLSAVVIEEARIKPSRDDDSWTILAQNLTFRSGPQDSWDISIPTDLYTNDSPYTLRIRGYTVETSGKRYPFRFVDQVSIARERELNSMWDAMAF